MNEDKASPAFRLSIRAVIGATPADPTSLRNIITHVFPDGALCFVLENRSLYQLDKGSSAVADNVNIVAPVGGPGRWFQMVQAPGAEAFVEIVGTANNTVDTSGTTNLVAVQTALFDWMPTGAPAGWSLTAAGGILTYGGDVAARALVTLESSVYLPAVEAEDARVWGAIAKNGDVLATDPTTSFILGTQVTETGAVAAPQVLSAQRTMSLAPGDTIQMAFASPSGIDVTLARATLSVLLG